MIKLKTFIFNQLYHKPFGGVVGLIIIFTTALLLMFL